MSTITLNPDDLAATRTNLGLGTASTLNYGSANGNVPVIGSDGKLPSSLVPASGESIDLTASGAVTAGKTLVLNANGTVIRLLRPQFLKPCPVRSTLQTKAHRTVTIHASFI